MQEIPYEKGTKKRVLVLGDSFAYGFGVNDSDTFAVRLQENLGENYEVIPLAASGFGTGQELLQLKHEGLKYNPDIVMLLFFQNDISNTQQIDQAYADKPIFKMVKQIEIKGIDQSQKKQYIARLLSGDRPQLNLLQTIMHPNDEALIINNDTIIVANYPTKMTWNDNYGSKKKSLSREKPLSALLLRFSHLYSLIYHKFSDENSGKSKRYSERTSDGQDRYLEKDYGPEAEEGIFLMNQLFYEFERVSETKKYKLLVVNIPDKRNVNKVYQEKFLQQFIDVDESDFDFRKVDTIFSQNLSGSSIGYISLFDLAEEHFDEFYFKNDPHWNPRGITLSADYITEKLKEQKII
ncbi:MAG: SGNH/GDSL hydrolase family protein [Nanoarchaeota archaeon]